jgi:hypothetical protein
VPPTISQAKLDSSDARTSLGLRTTLASRSLRPDFPGARVSKVSSTGVTAPAEVGVYGLARYQTVRHLAARGAAIVSSAGAARGVIVWSSDGLGFR